jgi:hypothetical protein
VPGRAAAENPRSDLQARDPDIANKRILRVLGLVGQAVGEGLLRLCQPTDQLYESILSDAVY